MTGASPKAQLLCTALWRRHDVPGFEYFRLWTAPQGPRLQGSVLVTHEGVPLRVDYAVTCSPAWETRVVAASVTLGATERRLELVVDEERRWWSDRRELEALRGQIDVDFGVSAATNLLPIRRLGLLDAPPGEPHDVTAAWVDFPSLAIEILPQRYTRVAGGRFHYESAGGAFKTDLEVDALGVAVSYPPGWDRVAVFPPPPPLDARG